MKWILVFLTASFWIVPSSIAFGNYAPKVDSSEESSIVFLQMKAVTSSKIIHFSWDVDAEQNGDHFIVEKSIDNGNSWEQVTLVASLGVFQSEESGYRR